MTASIECERANKAAIDILKLRDGEKLKVVDERIKAIDQQLSKKESLISERKKADLVAERQVLNTGKMAYRKTCNKASHTVLEDCNNGSED